MTALALIGFGEAAQAIARGLHGADAGATVTAYDIRGADPAQFATLAAIAQAAGARMVPDLAEALSGAWVVLSLVPGSAAVAVASAVAPLLQEGQSYLDLNSVSPERKRAVAAEIWQGAGECVEGAVMDAVTPHGHRVPILLAGPEAARVARVLNEIDMCCEAVGPEIGTASAVKMIRSVMIKGVEALILEAMAAAERAGVTECILDSVDRTFVGLDWRRLTAHYLRRTHEHGVRRASEMKQAAETLRGMGLEPAMSAAIAATIADGHARLSSRPYDPAASYPALLATLTQPAPAREPKEDSR